jgi:hypothetical protein
VPKHSLPFALQQMAHVGRTRLSEDRRSEIEGLIALSPWIVFFLLIVWSEIWAFRDKRHDARASPAQDVAELPGGRRATHPPS